MSTPHADLLHPASDWPAPIRADFTLNQASPRVGTRLLLENDRVRVWEIRLAPGQRIGFHRHVLDYLWTAVTPGAAESHMSDGTVAKATYAAGDTRYFRYGKGEFKVHDLRNTGATDLVFTTVELVESANPPLALDTDASDP